MFYLIFQLFQWQMWRTIVDFIKENEINMMFDQCVCYSCWRYLNNKKWEVDGTVSFVCDQYLSRSRFSNLVAFNGVLIDTISPGLWQQLNQNDFYWTEVRIEADRIQWIRFPANNHWSTFFILSNSSIIWWSRFSSLSFWSVKDFSKLKFFNRQPRLCSYFFNILM